LLNQAAIEARNIARGLRAAEIDSAGLMAALQDLVAREIWNTPCRLEIKTELNLHDDAVASHLYRLLREAMVNANKHARAKEIVVEISRSKSQIVFSVMDDGVGIPVDINNAHGLGFHIMKYCAHCVGASLEIKRRPRGGTQVTCYLPQPK
jgi:signal transduction histidine kinase